MSIRRGLSREFAANRLLDQETDECGEWRFNHSDGEGEGSSAAYWLRLRSVSRVR